jgi:hypothetical protein
MARFEKLTVTELNPGKQGGAAPVKLPSYTLATVPAAAAWEGHMIWISDATPPNLAVSDGTNWIAADDGLTAA